MKTTKIIQFQVCRPWDTVIGKRDMIFGLGEDGVVYMWDENTKLWISYTRNEFMAEGK